MKAIYFEKFGSADVLRFGDMPDPKPGHFQVVVEMKAASINPVDYKIVEGDGPPFPLFKKFPRIPGSDFAGVVLETGSGVKRIKPGDHVYGISSSFFGGPGSHAEKVVANIRVVRKIPEGLNFETMGAIPVGALTALHGLTQCGDVKGKRILLTGGSGGVGHFALQLAKYFGAHVTTVCSEKNIAFVKKLGADETLDYKKTNLETYDGKFDIFFDAYGLTPLATAARLMGKGGIYITTLPRGMNIVRAVFGFAVRNPRVVMANLSIKKSGFELVEKLLQEKKLQAVIAARFPLAQGADAYRSLMQGGHAGKVLLI